MAVKGIDVSDYQGATYSTKGFGFVFVKATEGVSYVNPKMKVQADRAREAGCVVGFYHFLWPGNIEAQARFFVNRADRRDHDVLAVDWETTGGRTTATCADKDAFIRAVQKLTGGKQRVLLYCNRDFWLNRDTTSFAGDGLWIADYNGKPGQPGIKAKWLFHQYTDRPIDTNLSAFADKAALVKWAGGQSKPAPAFPGRAAFGPGKSNTSILRLGQQLVKKGYGKHYRVGPSKDWSEADRRNVKDFQEAQGWSGSDADGYPGPETWNRLFS